MKAPGRLLLIVLCSAGFSAVYILLCCWACLPFCPAACLDPHLSINSRPTVPGPLHFSGYSSVPDGKPLVREPCRSCAVVSSSGQMLGSGLGAEIDGAECVLRMNQAPTVGFEADVGQRSTLRVISHTSVPLLLRNYSHYFQQARDTLYVVWGQGKHMDRALGGRTYRALLQLTRMYPGLQVYTFTERMMAYCDQVFQDETGKNRIESNSGSSNSPFCAPGTELSTLAFKISFYPTPRRALELLWLSPLHTGFSPTSPAQKIQPPASSFLVKHLTLPSTPLVSSPVT